MKLFIELNDTAEFYYLTGYVWQGTELDKLPQNLLSVTLSKLTECVCECMMLIGLVNTK